MLANTTTDRLREMKMSIMAEHLSKQLTDPKMNELSFEDRLGLLVDAEWISRKNNRLTRLIRSAGYPYTDASMEDIEYRPDRGLDKALLTRLSTCAYVREKHNVILLSASGGGKTYLASALGMAAKQYHLWVQIKSVLQQLGPQWIICITTTRRTY